MALSNLLSFLSASPVYKLSHQPHCWWQQVEIIPKRGKVPALQGQPTYQYLLWICLIIVGPVCMNWDSQSQKPIRFAWKTFPKMVPTPNKCTDFSNYFSICCLKGNLPSALSRYGLIAKWMWRASTGQLTDDALKSESLWKLLFPICDRFLSQRSRVALPDSWEMHRILLCHLWNNYKDKHSWKNNASEESSKPQLNEGENVKSVPELLTCMPHETVKILRRLSSLKVELTHYPQLSSSLSPPATGMLTVLNYVPYWCLLNKINSNSRMQRWKISLWYEGSSDVLKSITLSLTAGENSSLYMGDCIH